MAITIPKLIRNSPVLSRKAPGFIWISEKATIWADGIMAVKNDEHLYHHLLHLLAGYAENTTYIVFPRGKDCLLKKQKPILS